MPEPRVIQADFANWRPVQGRKCLQLILEVPIEQTENVIKMLGVPMPGESKWVAVALLENGKCAGANAAGKPESAPKPSEASEAGDGQSGNSPTPTSAPIAKDGTSQSRVKDRRPFASLPLSQQAAIRCQDSDFMLFMGAAKGVEETAALVRTHCGVGSRSEIREGERSGVLWHGIEEQFQSWLTDNRYAGMRR